MRLKIVAAAIVVTAIVAALLVSVIAVQEFGPQPAARPGCGDGVSAPYQGFTSVTPSGSTGRGDLSRGMTSTDFLGQVRNMPVIDRLISLFPGTWLAGRTTGGADDKAEYLDFTYVRSATPASHGSVFYSGEQHNGRQIYISPDDMGRPGMPGRIYLRSGYGFDAYELSGEPPVYAYVAYGAFNANESVRFGVLNNGGSVLDLMNSAPFEIQRKEGGSWRTVFSPVAAQVITPLQNGTAKEWQWDQRLNNDSMASFGDYRVLVDGRYSASFRLAPDTPAVERSSISYDRLTVASLANVGAVSRAFGKAYPSPSADTKGDIVSIMEFKAKALGLDPDSLRKAIDAAGTDALPCLAIYGDYEGRPAWIIAFSQGAGASAMSVPDVYAVDESSGSATRIGADK